ncbi:MAG: hypothetical protein AAGE52_33970, partial [Myxococcota bacterium]
VSMTPREGLLLKVDGHIFGRPEMAGQSNYAGAEMDLHVIWKPLPGFRMRAMYGLFVPNEAHWGRSDRVRYLEVEVGYDLR